MTLDFAASRGLAHGSLNMDIIVLYGEPSVVCLREFGLHSLNRKIISAYTSFASTAMPRPSSKAYNGTVTHVPETEEEAKRATVHAQH